MGDWQPISTAPKDGTLVVLKCEHRPEYGEHVLKWSHQKWNGMWFTPMRRIRVFWDEHAEQPTHWKPWQPLPAPPETNRE